MLFNIYITNKCELEMRPRLEQAFPACPDGFSYLAKNLTAI